MEHSAEEAKCAIVQEPNNKYIKLNKLKRISFLYQEDKQDLLLNILKVFLNIILTGTRNCAFRGW